MTVAAHFEIHGHEESQLLAERTVPLTPQQQRMLLLHELDATNVAYNTAAAFHLRGPLDVPRLLRAFESLVERHDILRTAFQLIDGAPCATVRAKASFDTSFLDVTATSPELRSAEARRTLREVLERRMDLTRTPLHVALVRVDTEHHVLSVNLHHIACDGWSFAVVMDDLALAYADAKQLDREPRAAQYADYADWFARRRAQPAYARGVAHFAQALKDAPACLELPWDRQRPAVQTYRGRLITRRLSASMSGAIQRLAAAERLTPFTLVLSTFALILRIYARKPDLVIGVPVANRERTEHRSAVGFFVNTLPLRFSLDDEQTFLELAHRTKTTMLAALDHQSTQIEDIVAALGLTRDASYAPVYQAMFLYQNAPVPSRAWPGLTLEPELLGTVGAKGDLSLNIDHVGSELWCSWELSEELFDVESIEAMADCFEHVLGQAVSDPSAPLKSLSLTAPEQCAILLERGSGEVLEEPAVGTFELFSARAQRTPGAVAVEHAGLRWTYEELVGRAASLSGALAEQGVGRGDLVGLASKRCPEMLAGILAVWRLGAAYVPLDPAYPLERLRFMLQDAGVAACLVGPGTSALELPPELPRVDLLSSSRITPPPTPAGRSELAYVMYTSGSTGRPKGVAIEHGSVVSLVSWAQSEYSDDELARVLGSTSICFDLSVFELFVPLCSGGAVILVDDALAFAADRARPKVSLVNTVPSALAELLHADAIGPEVLIINTCGEVLPNETAQQAYRQTQVRAVYNLYGPTEDTVYSTALRVPRGFERTLPIGKPIPNSRAYVLDEHGRLAALGVPGELHLAGRGLARGYLHREELTAERFVEMTVPPARRERAYRTGDVARFRANGELHFLGRVDHQVKLRGYRIELGEIDRAVTRVDGVREAVTLVRRAPSGEADLICYYVATGAIEADALRSELARWLPSYMIPSHFLGLAELPRTPNGKLARDALPAPAVARRGSTRQLTAIEATIAEELAALLRVDRVDAEDDFFSLGGSSLLAARAAARLSRKLGRNVEIRDLFRYPKLQDLARQLGARAAALPADAERAASSAQVECDEFTGFHVNCYYHCLLQSLSFFERKPIHSLGDAAAAFLGYLPRFRALSPDSVLASTLYREVILEPEVRVEDRLRELFGMERRELELPRDLAALVDAVRGGAFAILVGGSDLVIDPSIPIVGLEETGEAFTTVGNDFRVGMARLSFDARRVQHGEQALVLRLNGAPRPSSAALNAAAFQRHVQSRRRAPLPSAVEPFREWLRKYESRPDPEHRAGIRVEVEGVNVTMGTELASFLRFERHVIAGLPSVPPRLQAYADLLSATLRDYQQQTNALRRALLNADELTAGELNAKIVAALRVVLARQTSLAESLKELEF